MSTDRSNPLISISRLNFAFGLSSLDFSTPEGRQVDVPNRRAHSLLSRCFYIGGVEGEEGSVAALNLCGGLRGIFRAGHETFNIEPAVLAASEGPAGPASASLLSGDGAEGGAAHIVYRDSDLAAEQGGEEPGRTHFRCGVHDDSHETHAVKDGTVDFTIAP